MPYCRETPRALRCWRVTEDITKAPGWVQTLLRDGYIWLREEPGGAPRPPWVDERFATYPELMMIVQQTAMSTEHVNVGFDGWLVDEVHPHLYSAETFDKKFTIVSDG